MLNRARKGKATSSQLCAGGRRLNLYAITSKKGQMIAVQGHIQTGKFNGKNGVDYKIFEIVADKVSFCGDKTGGGNSTQYVENAEEAEYFGVNDDELPF